MAKCVAVTRKVAMDPGDRGRLVRYGTLLRRLVADDQGQDLIEYALLASIVGISGILVFPAIASKMTAAFTNWSSNADALWIPPPP